MSIPIQQILSGQDDSFTARSLRITTALAEPFYSLAMLVRNKSYDQGIFKITHLSKPTVSVGNITTGGTGKTPVVRWLAERLRAAGRHPAVLLRGYRSSATGFSDEQQLLDRALNSTGESPIPVQPNPSRIAGAAQVLAKNSTVDVFVLDDAFQHRKVHRDFNLVLISAPDPFGYNHVLPRGLLRESLAGLSRADAFLITRASQATPDALQLIEQELKTRNPAAPIYRADHAHAALWTPHNNHREQIDALLDQKYFAFCGIGNPAAFSQQLRSQGGQDIGHEWFPDHHAYTAADLADIQSRAMKSGAARIITTEKDWVKLDELPGSRTAAPPISVVELNIAFHGDDADNLFKQIVQKL